ncbi:MAG: hypothetical protein DLM53_07030 [Candidatus Eremiobacter antarcticus]|nr:MAG: hypothetical protein DLM53_07030 [Candidatus Eremiobacter sp. RRmetagenome_bin22]
MLWLLSAMLGVFAIPATAHAELGSLLPLRTVTDIPLSGGTTRFDYESLDAQRRRLFVAHMGDDSVIVIDIDRRRVVGSVHQTRRVRGVLAVPALGRVFVAAEADGAVIAIDERTLHVLRRIPAGDVDGLAYDPKTKRLFVSDEAGEAVTVIDAVSFRRLGSIRIGGEAGNTVFDNAAGRIVTANQSTNALVVIDPSSQVIERRIPLAGCTQAHGVAIDSAGRRAFIACQGNAMLVAVDLTSGLVLARQQLGAGPDVLALDESLHRLYVAAESGILTVLDIAQPVPRVVARGLFAPNAHVVAVDPRDHTLFFPLPNMGGRPVLRIAAPRR